MVGFELMVSPPEWLASLVNAVTPNIHSHDLLAPLGCHFQQVQGVWEITLFASRTEIVGGHQDGLTYDSGFNVDVIGLQAAFTTVEAISWQSQSLGSDDDLGSHLSLDGMLADRKIWLRITSSAPDRFDVGRRAFVHQKKIEEIW